MAEPPEVEPAPAPGEARRRHLQRGLRLEVFTVAYNVLEAGIALAAAWLAGSVALLGFGFDSVVETLSGAVLLWRLRREGAGAEPAEVARVETRAQRLVAASLILLGLVVLVESARSLWTARLPEPSRIGIVLTALSVLVMFVLARAKRSVAEDLGSRAMEGDAFHTDACFQTAGRHWTHPWHRPSEGGPGGAGLRRTISVSPSVENLRGAGSAEPEAGGCQADTRWFFPHAEPAGEDPTRCALAGRLLPSLPARRAP